jgi:hypothetical protein
MKYIRLLLPLLLLSPLTLFSQSNTSKEPKVGSPIDGGTFLYRDHIEGYWNDWIGYPMTEKNNLPSNNQVEIAVKGEGKNIDFRGILSINCENGQNYWLAANADEPEENIPTQVTNNTVSIFCNNQIAHQDKNIPEKNNFPPIKNIPTNTEIPQTYSSVSSQSISCINPNLITIAKEMYEKNIFNLLLSKNLGIKITYEKFLEEKKKATNPKDKAFYQTVLQRTQQAYNNLSLSIKLSRTINKDTESGVVECKGVLDLGNGKVLDIEYNGQFSNNGEIYVTGKSFF